MDGATFGALRSVVDCASLTAPSLQQVEFVSEIGEDWPDIMFPGNQYMQFMLGNANSPLMIMQNADDDANRSEVAMNNAVDDAEAAAISIDAADEAVAEDRLLTPSKANQFLSKLKLGSSSKRSIARTQSEDEVRRRLINECVSLVLQVPLASTTGAQLMQLDNEDERFTIVDHCLGDSKNNSVITRLSPVRMYDKWAEKAMKSIEFAEGLPVKLNESEWVWGWWPPSEEQIYRCCKEFKSDSTAKMLLQGLRYLEITFGFDFSSLFSPRVRGIANIRVGAMPEVKKARAALGHVVPKLEIVIEVEEVHPVYRNQAGANMMHLMTRTRHSNWHWKYKIVITPDEILVLVTRTKTSGKKSREEIALVGPVASCTGRNWLMNFVDFRKAQGIPLEDFPLEPAMKDGVWLNEHATIGETNKINKELMEMICEDPSRATTHMWKHTAITLCALDGVPKDVRSGLAYHKVGNKATDAYDQSRLKGLVPRYKVAFDNYFQKLDWTDLQTKQVQINLIGKTGMHYPEEWSDLEVAEKSDADSGDEDLFKKSELESVEKESQLQIQKKLIKPNHALLVVDAQ